MGWSVRTIPDAEFDLILRAGYAPVLKADDELGAVPATAPYAVDGLGESEQLEIERPLVETLSLRRFRDRVFTETVRSAYDSRCAITGLRLINGGGRTEAEAAHIRPVASNGPDTVRNGLALSRTVHWMFDRGLISLDDDCRLLTAKPLIPEGMDRLFDPSGYAQVPIDERARPNPAFLRWHRENCFKG